MKAILLCSLLILTACSPKGGVLFQDDFETHPLGEEPKAPWMKTGDGVAVIDNTKSVSGSKSVHFITGEGYQNRAFIGLSHLFPVKKNRYSGRLQMYVEEASADGIHWTILQSKGKVKGKKYTSEIRYGGQHNQCLMANYETFEVKSDCWHHSTTQIPEQEWFELEWHFDGKNNLMQLWLNGEQIEELTVKDKGQGCVGQDTEGWWHFPVFEEVLMGWVDYQKGGGIRHVWVDDVVIYITY